MNDVSFGRLISSLTQKPSTLSHLTLTLLMTLIPWTLSCIPTPESHRNVNKKASSLLPHEGAKPKRLVLPNGLTILTLEDHSAPVVSVQVWAKTGSIYEGDHLGAGLSHILEHMLFKGTEKRGVADISRQVEAHGGYINAYTTWERTVYHIDIPSEGGKPGTAAGTEMAIDILADAMRHSTLPKNEYDKEQQVILREMAMGHDNPDRQASELFFATTYSIHPARHPVIGYEEVYRALSREEVMAYYKARYIPNNLIFVVVGDMNTTKVENQIESTLGDWKRQSLPDFYIPDEPAQITPRVVTEECVSASNDTRIHIGYPTCDFRHPDAAALEILSYIAGNGMSSRLYQNLREKQKIVREIDAWSYTPSWRGIFGVSAQMDPMNADKVKNAILKELDAFRKQRVTPSELLKAKKIALSSQLSARKTMSGLAADIASNEILTGDLDYSDQYLRQLEDVSAEDVLRVAKTYFIPEHLVSTTVVPKGFLKTRTSVSQVTVESPIQRTALPNQLTLLTKEDHRLPFVQLRLVMKAGSMFEAPENAGISQLTSTLLLKGTQKRTAAEIAYDIESVGGSISAYSGANSMGASLEVLRDDLPLAMEVLSDIVQHSTFPGEIIEAEKANQIGELKKELEHPLRLSMQIARDKLFGDHPYHMPRLGTKESVSRIQRDQILQHWKRVASPANMVLAVFGDIDSKSMNQLTGKYFSKLKGEPVPLPDVPPPAFGSSERIITEQDKEQSVVVIALPGVDIRHPDRAALELMNGAMAGMGSRLFYRLRDQLALCYYVGSNQMVGLDSGFIYFYIGTDPAKAGQAEKEILSEIAKLQKDGITEEELDRSRNGILGERKMQKQSLGDLALSAALDEVYGLGYDFSDKLDEQYAHLTTKDVDEAAKKYLSKPFVVSVVRPHASTTTPSEAESPTKPRKAKTASP